MAHYSSFWEQVGAKEIQCSLARHERLLSKAIEEKHSLLSDARNPAVSYAGREQIQYHLDYTLSPRVKEIESHVAHLRDCLRRCKLGERIEEADIL